MKTKAKSISAFLKISKNAEMKRQELDQNDSKNNSDLKKQIVKDCFKRKHQFVIEQKNLYPTLDLNFSTHEANNLQYQSRVSKVSKSKELSNNNIETQKLPKKINNQNHQVLSFAKNDLLMLSCIPASLNLSSTLFTACRYVL